ncbi:MAG TPA: hypothetical protein DEO64_16060 [Alcaligenes faecalis]|nr:hypothetical protein [Alcaligenes faecalis]
MTTMKAGSDIPSCVMAAFEKSARSISLIHYIGDRFAIEDLDASHRICTFSTSLGIGQRKGLALLSKLSEAGMIREEPKSYSGQMRVFKPHPELASQLFKEAREHWKSMGYEIGVISERKHEKSI